MRNLLADPRRAALAAYSLAIATLSLMGPAHAEGPSARGLVQDVQMPTAERAYGTVTLTTRLGPVPIRAPLPTNRCARPRGPAGPSGRRTAKRRLQAIGCRL